jgi:hypothetical protein
MTGLPSDIGVTAIAVMLAAKLGPEFVKGIFRKSSSNGVCHAGEIVIPAMESHKGVLARIESSNNEIVNAVRDGNKGIDKLVTVMEERRGRR